MLSISTVLSVYSSIFTISAIFYVHLFTKKKNYACIWIVQKIHVYLYYTKYTHQLNKINFNNNKSIKSILQKYNNVVIWCTRKIPNLHTHLSSPSFLSMCRGAILTASDVCYSIVKRNEGHETLARANGVLVISRLPVLVASVSKRRNLVQSNSMLSLATRTTNGWKNRRLKVSGRKTYINTYLDEKASTHLPLKKQALSSVQTPSKMAYVKGRVITFHALQRFALFLPITSVCLAFVPFVSPLKTNK